MITENQNSQVSNNDTQPAPDAHQSADSIHVIEYNLRILGGLMRLWPRLPTCCWSSFYRLS